MPQPSVRADTDACPGALRLHAAADGPLARVRVPGGRMTGAQLRTVRELAEECGDGHAELTNRANLQLRALKDAPAVQLAARLGAAGLLPSQTHELVRNIAASPLAGGPLDVPSLVATLDRELCADPALASLPGRFLFAADNGQGDVASGADAAAIPLGDEVAILFAGVDAGLRVTPDEVVPALLAAAHAFLDERAAQQPPSGESAAPPAAGPGLEPLSYSDAAPGSGSQARLASPGTPPDGYSSSTMGKSVAAPDDYLPPPADPGTAPGELSQPTTGNVGGAPAGPGAVTGAHSRPTTGSLGEALDHPQPPPGPPSQPLGGDPDAVEFARQASTGPSADVQGRRLVAWRVRELADGPARVAARTAAALGRTLGEPTALSRPGVREPIGLVEQPDGLFAVGALVPLGRLSGAQLRVLESAATLVFTPWRGVVVPDLTPAAAESWIAALAGAGLEVAGGSRWVGVTTCAGRPGCAKSLADVRHDAFAATTAGEGLPVHWVGCARGCGSPAGPHVRVEAIGSGYVVRSPHACGFAPTGDVATRKMATGDFATDPNAAGGTSSSKIAADNTAARKPATGDKSSDENAVDHKARHKTATGDKSSDENAVDHQARHKTATGDNTSDENAVDHQARRKMATGSGTAEDKTNGDATGADAATGEIAWGDVGALIGAARKG